jgi:hypothetical protein
MTGGLSVRRKAERRLPLSLRRSARARSLSVADSAFLKKSMSQSVPIQIASQPTLSLLVSLGSHSTHVRIRAPYHLAGAPSPSASRRSGSPAFAKADPWNVVDYRNPEDVESAPDRENPPELLGSPGGRPEVSGKWAAGPFMKAMHGVEAPSCRRVRLCSSYSARPANKSGPPNWAALPGLGRMELGKECRPGYSICLR